jgi:hypothetical protein
LAGGRYRNYAADGKITEGTFQTGEVIYRDPLTHAAENIGDKPMHLILVEHRLPFTSHFVVAVCSAKEA